MSDFKKELNEVLDEREEKANRKRITSVYWKSRAICVARGMHPPKPPPWINIPWEPQKGIDPITKININKGLWLC